VLLAQQGELAFHAKQELPLRGNLSFPPMSKARGSQKGGMVERVRETLGLLTFLGYLPVVEAEP
jgi:hypothetical protein